MGGVDPFNLERHASVYAPLPLTTREPSIYVSEDSEYAQRLAQVAQPEPEDPPDHTENGNYGVQLPFVEPPALHVLEGRASGAEVAEEMRRLIGSLGEHLSRIGEQVAEMEPRRASGLRARDD